MSTFFIQQIGHCELCQRQSVLLVRYPRFGAAVCSHAVARQSLVKVWNEPLKNKTAKGPQKPPKLSTRTLTVNQKRKADLPG